MPHIEKDLIENDILKVNNFSKGRKYSGYGVDVIVIHVTQGTAASTDSWFENDDSDVSSHYHIDKSGNIKMYVLEEDTAWGNGRVNKPTSEIVKARLPVNPNLYTISIEHEGSGLYELTDAQYESSRWLIHDICRRRKIPMNRKHIIRHQEIYSVKTCPGKISVDRLVAGINNIFNDVTGGHS